MFQDVPSPSPSPVNINVTVGWQYGTIPPGEPPSRVGVPAIPNEMLARWPFPEVDLDAPLEPNDFWDHVALRR